MSRHATPLFDRIADKIEIDFETGCWNWTATRSSGGYGRAYTGGTYGSTVVAHRALYELVVEPVPAELTLDHLCRNRGCLNPDHLEPVSLRENLMRGDTMAARNAAKTHCDRGHEFTQENTYVYADGRRACRTCIRDSARERMRRVRCEKREAAA